MKSLLLLQGAVSPLCFARNVLGDGQPGGYRATFERVDQPILATFSPHDFPLTSFMDGGEIIEENAPEEFFKNPPSERTKLFLSQILHH